MSGLNSEEYSFNWERDHPSSKVDCESECSDSHGGRNCLHCRERFGSHAGHGCLREGFNGKRGDFSLSHQTWCSSECYGVHLGKLCNVCAKTFEEHYHGHWCDEEKTQRACFLETLGEGIKPAKRN